MKNFVFALSLAGLALGLAACETTGKNTMDDGPGYALERTAGGQKGDSDRVFRGGQNK